MFLWRCEVQETLYFDENVRIHNLFIDSTFGCGCPRYLFRSFHSLKSESTTCLIITIIVCIEYRVELFRLHVVTFLKWMEMQIEYCICILHSSTNYKTVVCCLLSHKHNNVALNYIQLLCSVYDLLKVLNWALMCNVLHQIYREWAKKRCWSRCLDCKSKFLPSPFVTVLVLHVVFKMHRKQKPQAASRILSSPINNTNAKLISAIVASAAMCIHTAERPTAWIMLARICDLIDSER